MSTKCTILYIYVLELGLRELFKVAELWYIKNSRDYPCKHKTISILITQQLLYSRVYICVFAHPKENIGWGLNSIEKLFKSRVLYNSGRGTAPKMRNSGKTTHTVKGYHTPPPPPDIFKNSLGIGIHILAIFDMTLIGLASSPSIH
jgi:hypothetical protein